MSKELEALAVLKQTIFHHTRGCLTTAEEEALKTIETALKDYEMEHTLRIRLENINYELVREKQENDKKLKALDILKKCCLLSKHELAFTNKIEISQEEYDLLKDVLL